MDRQKRPDRSRQITHDTQLDAYRALTMAYIVSVIHAIYWFDLFNEWIRSVLLFEMPVIFFIAGASQQLAREKNLRQTVVNRCRRLLPPYYIFLACLMVLMLFTTWLCPHIGHWNADLRQIPLRDYLKILLTGGSDNVPFYGYTWFISCYLIISCLLPLQRKIINRMPHCLYMALLLLVCTGFNFIHLPMLEREVKNIVFYNFFYISGYLYYRQLKTKTIYMLAVVSTVVTASLFISDQALPMQEHKFPADMVFLVFGTSAICLLALVFQHIKFPSPKENQGKTAALLSLWNRQGYVIYIWQTVTFTIVYSATYKWIDRLPSDTVKFLILAPALFIISTIIAAGYEKISRLTMIKKHSNRER